MIGLPAPRLTAIIDGRGNVSIPGEEIELAPGGPVGRTNARAHCSACGRAGHISSNRRCPAGGRAA